MRSAGTKYEELCDGLREEILNKLRPGDSLDSERTLVERFGVSRVTVRRSLNQLDAEGLIVRVHGSGTYVSDSQLIGKTLRLTSFTDDMRERGLEASSVVLTSDVIHADTALATLLRLLAGADVLRLRRLRLADRTPMALEDAFVPLELFPAIEERDLTTSLYASFSDYGYQVDRARQQITSVALTEEEAKLLGRTRGTPALRVDRVSMDRLGRPLERSPASTAPIATTSTSPCERTGEPSAHRRRHARPAASRADRVVPSACRQPDAPARRDGGAGGGRRCRWRRRDQGQRRRGHQGHPGHGRGADHRTVQADRRVRGAVDHARSRVCPSRRRSGL
jgi:GntR family transcriptional regulator